MTNLFSIFSEAELEAEVEQGFVSWKLDPGSNRLAILNYTPAAAFSRRWNAVTLASRGLIYDVETKEIVARPFAKFFNYGEVKPELIPLHKPAVVTPKFDGSLGILYPEPGYPYEPNHYSIATRGSFVSDQALWASDFWHKNHADVVAPEGVTPLFEIIYPHNRIVVDYGATEALVLLALIDNRTGADIPLAEARDWWDGPVVPVIDELADPQAAWEAVVSGKFRGAEGLVLCWPMFGAPSMRVKIKDDEYIRLHRIVTGVSTKTIWQALKNGESLNELLDNVPDEFNEWVRGQIAHFEQRFQERYNEVIHEYNGVLLQVFPMGSIRGTKKELALAIKDRPDKAYLFALWDGKDISQQVWQELKPEYSTPFAEEE